MHTYIHTYIHILQDALKWQFDAMGKTSVWGLQLLVFEALKYECLRPQATSV